MEDDLSIEKQLEYLINDKLNICNCEPCTCPKQTKDQYFQQLKDILKEYNNEKFVLDFLDIELIKSLHNKSDDENKSLGIKDIQQ